MLTVGAHAYDVEARLAGGRLACPGCGSPLRPWGHARPRVLRGEGMLRHRLRPRRARCVGCGGTHVLLPVMALLRRADLMGVIGAALAAKAAGAGHRWIAQRLGRPEGTVRGWLRRFAARAGPIRDAFTVVACELEADPRLPEPAGSDVADAVAAIVAAAGAAGRRWGGSAFTVSPWRLACAVTSGRLLMPGHTVELINTSRLW